MPQTQNASSDEVFHSESYPSPHTAARAESVKGALAVMHSHYGASDDSELDITADYGSQNSIQMQRASALLYNRRSIIDSHLNPLRERLVQQISSTSRKKKLKGHVFTFLERPTGWVCFFYHFIVFSLVLSGLLISVLATIEQYEKFAEKFMFWTEGVIVVVLTTEFLVRLWSSDVNAKYKGMRGKLKFLMRPVVFVDLSVCVASMIVLFIGSDGKVFATSSLRVIRFVQMLRLLHLDRNGSSWKLLGSVIYNHQEELITTLYIGFLLLIFISYVVFMVEKDVAKETSGGLNTYADALWWSMVTVTTIGYGDIVPQTWVGKVLASCLALVGIIFFALPSDILGLGLALKVQQKQREKHFNRQIPAAASLVQCLWRCYAAEANNSPPFTATWKVHEVFMKLQRPKKLRKKHLHHLTTSKQQLHSIWARHIDEHEHHENHQQMLKNKNQWARLNSSLETDDGQDGLSNAEKYAIRLIRRMKFCVARRKFQQARKPYDLRDAMDCYSEGNVNMTVKIREIQRHLDQTIGRIGTQLKCERELSEKDREKLTVIGRFTEVQDQLEETDSKLDQFLAKLDIVLEN